MSWLKGRYDHGSEPRDRYGPMEIDEPDPLAKLNQYTIQDDSYGEGPSRKRLHSDLSTPSRPFTAHNRTIHVTPSTPFLFNVSNLQVPPMPEQKPFQYDPSVFQGSNAQKMDWGFSPRIERFGEDVEMSESPARPSWGTSSHPEPSGPNLADESMEIEVEEIRQEQEEPKRDTEAPVTIAESKEDKKAKVEDVQPEEPSLSGKEGSATSEKTGDTVSQRVFAMGGVKREMRNRQKKKQNRNEGTVNRRRDDYSRRNGSEHVPGLKHSEIPALIIGYIQVFVNASIVVFALYLGIQLVLTIRRDVKDRMQEASLEMRQEIAECTKLFVTNRCDPEFRVPAMEDHCRNWEACMNRDPTMVGRINVMAETFAGVINSFVEAMSWKTMGFTLATLSFLIILTNSALWNLRQKASPDPQHPPPVYVGMLPHPSFNHRGLNQIGGLMGHAGQSMGSIGQLGADWGMPSDAGYKQIGYGEPEKKKKWKLW